MAFGIVVEKELLGMSKEDFVELCRRVSDQELTEEDQERGYFCTEVEMAIRVREDLDVKDLIGICNTAFNGGTMWLDEWVNEDGFLLKKFRRLSLTDRLIVLEGLDGEHFVSAGNYLLKYLFWRGFDLDVASAIHQVIAVMFSANDDDLFETPDITKSLVKLIRLELGIQ